MIYCNITTLSMLLLQFLAFVCHKGVWTIVLAHETNRTWLTCICCSFGVSRSMLLSSGESRGLTHLCVQGSSNNLYMHSDCHHNDNQQFMWSGEQIKAGFLWSASTN